MAGDRTAELLIKSRMESGDVTEKTRAIRTEIERAGDAADGTAAELQQAVVAVTNLGHAEQATATETAEVARALEVAGQAAVEMGADAAQGANAVTIAIEEVSAAAREEAAALEATAREAAEGAARSRAEIERVTASLREQFDAIRASGNPYAQQLAALQAFEAELQDVARGEKANTDLSRAHAEASAAGLTEVRQHISQVTAELDKQAAAHVGLGAKAKAALDSIKGPTITLEGAFIKAAEAIQKVDAEIAETGRVGPRAIGFAAQAVETYRETVIRARGSIEAARQDEVEGLQRLETHLTRVTSQANRLTNAAKDNAVRLGETGTQVAGLAGGIQNLTQLLGPNAASLGLVAGNAAILASTYEGLKDSVAAMNLNTLAMGGSNATAAIQIAAVAAAALGGIAAGTKLARLNKENAQTLDDLKESAIGAGHSITDDLVAAIDASQRGFQDLISNLDLVLDGNYKATTSVRGLKDQLQGFFVAIDWGSKSLDVYNELLRQGFDRYQAARAASDDASRAETAYAKAKEQGGAALEEWNTIARESKGNADNLMGASATLTKQLDNEAKVLKLLNEEQQRKTMLNQRDLDLTKIHEGAIEHLMTAQERNLDLLSRANRDLEEATHGSTAALNDALNLVQIYIPASARHAEQLRGLSKGILAVTGDLDGLSAAQRRNLTLVAETIARGEELTESEKLYVAQLAEAIRLGNENSAAMTAQALTSTALKDSMAALLGVVQQRRIAEGDLSLALADRTAKELENETAIKRAVDAAKAKLAASVGLTAAERAQYEQMIELAKQIDDLAKIYDKAKVSNEAAAKATDTATEATKRHRAALKDLGDENTSTMDALAASHEQFLAETAAFFHRDEEAQAEHESTVRVIVSGRLADLQREMDAKAQEVEAIQKSITANKQLADSHGELHKIIEGGKEIWTNLTEAELKAQAATSGLGTAADKAGHQFGDVFVAQMGGGLGTIINVKDESGAAAKNIEAMGTQATTFAASLGAAQEPTSSFADALLKANTGAGPLAGNLKLLNDIAPALASNLAQILIVTEKLGPSLDGVAKGIAATNAAAAHATDAQRDKVREQ